MKKTGFAIYEFEFGLLKIGYEDDVVVLLQRIDEAEGRGKRTKFTDEVYAQVLEYLDGKRSTFDFTYKLNGTEFQQKVWEQLIKIPYGQTRTYKEIATAIGNPKATRAVGMANNKNPVTIAVPCHRVIGSNEKMVGYAGGLKMKVALLNMEKQNKEDLI